MSIDALQAKIRKLKNPSMIGLDPTVELLPPHLLEEAYRTHGQSLEALAAAYETFCGEILQALQGLDQLQCLLPHTGQVPLIFFINDLA